MRKLLAVLLAAVMLVTSLSCLTLMTVSADSAATVTPYTPDTFATANADNAVVDFSENVLAGDAEWVVGTWPTNIYTASSDTSVTAGMLYDGDFSQLYQCYNWYKPSTAISCENSYITFSINASYAKVDKIFLAGAENSKLLDFKVYLGMDKATLYSEENLVATYNASDANLDKYIYDIELSEAVQAKYVGFKFTDIRGMIDYATPGYDQYAPAISAVGAYGTLPYSVDAYTKDEFTTANAGNAIANLSGDNLLTGNPEYKICGVVDGAYGSIVSDAQPAGISSAWLYNGAMQQVWQRSEWSKPYTSHSADKSYITFNIASGNFIAIDRIFLAGTADSTLADFELYLGNDKETLYNAENMVATYSGPEGTDKYVYWVELDEGKEAKYLGIRVPTLRSVHDLVNPYNTYALELTGMGVYGTSACTVSDNLYNGTTTDIPKDIPLNYNSYPVYTYHSQYKATDSYLTIASNKADMIALTNAAYKPDSGIAIYDGTYSNQYLRIAYDLKAPIDVESVILSSGNAGNVVNKWSVYVSNDLATLYDANNLYANVDVSSQVDTTKGMVTQVTFPEAVNGQYVGFHLADTSAGSSDAKDVRLSEIAIYGREKGTSAYTGNLLHTNVPGDNILNGITTFKYASANTVFDQNYNTITRESLCNNNSKPFEDFLTNNAFNDWMAIYMWNGLNHKDIQSNRTDFNNAIATGRFVFDIGEGKTATAGSVLVKGENNQANYKYKAYISNDPAIAENPALLFTPDNLFATVDASDLGSAMAFADKDHYKTGRFFGIMVYDGTASTLKVREIAFYAPNVVEAEVATSIPGNNLAADKNFYVGSGITPSTTPSTSDSNGQANSFLFNGSFDGWANRWWNIGDRHFYTDLGATVNLDQILIGMSTNSNDAYHTYGVYVSDDLSALFAPENLISMVYNKNKDKAHKFNLEGKNVKGRYVGVYQFTIPSDAGWGGTTMYLNEFGVYGSYDFDEPTDADLADLGNNLLDADGLTTDATIENAGLMTDNVKKTTFDNQMVAVAAGTKLTYDIGLALDLEKILVAAKTTGNYKVYASNDLATLYNEAVLNVNSAMISVYGIHDVDLNARYIGFEFTSDATVIELGAYAKADLSATFGENIDTVYVDGKNVGSSAVLDANIYKDNSAIVVKYADNSTKVFLVKGTTVTENAALANAFAYKGAQIRTNAPGGLRFVNTISADALAVATKVGTLAAKFADLNGADLTAIDTTDYVIADAVVYDTDIAIWKDGVEGDFSITINNIKDYLVATYYAARPYMVVTVDDVEYTVYGEEKVVSPVQIARMALEDENANLSADAFLYLDAMVNNANVMNTVYTYADSLGISGTQLEASVVNADADYSRLARVIEKARSGQPIKLTTLGGSITYGAYSSAQMAGVPQSVTCYANRFREYLANTFGVEVTLTNAGISATNSDVGIARFDTNVPADTDLLVIDFAVNDFSTGRTGDRDVEHSFDSSYEAIVRKAIAQDMAVIMLFNAKETSGTCTNDQIWETKIGNHYKIPMVSVLNAVWDGTAYREEIGSHEKYLSSDDIHPNTFGHKLLATLLANTVAKAISAYNADNTLAEAVSYMPADYLYTATAAKVNTVLYTSENLPEEWVVSMGDWDVDGSQYRDLLPNAWRIDDTATAPMTLSIPDATYVSVIYARPRLANNDEINANSPIYTFTLNGQAKSAYACYTDFFAVSTQLLCDNTATDCEVSVAASFKTDMVKDARIIGFAVAQAQ